MIYTQREVALGNITIERSFSSQSAAQSLYRNSNTKSEQDES
jgi:hypothetical protein